MCYTIGQMKPTILLVNPPIYDFTAYDFWLKPYGLLRVGGLLRGHADLELFDYMDRNQPDFDQALADKTTRWGCGPYTKTRVQKPKIFNKIPRFFNRFGRKKAMFCNVLRAKKHLDVVLIQTSLTYWYPGVKEVIDDVRRFHPRATIVLGGFYATCCPTHAAALGPDLVIQGSALVPLFEKLQIPMPQGFTPPAWELYPALTTGVIKLTSGCPFSCTYCYVPQSGQTFSTRPIDECIEEVQFLAHCGAKNIAFYDDALLFRPENVFFPFLQRVLQKNIKVNFHTPNALHARFLTPDSAQLMVKSGVKTFYLGFESRSDAFHARAGGKVISDDLAAAVAHLRRAGADMNCVTAYEMLGHPRFAAQQLESSMRFASELGIRVMLSDFSPIPGTPDGELCSDIVNLDEPLFHNKTAFPLLFLGLETVRYYKDLCRELNRRVSQKCV